MSYCFLSPYTWFTSSFLSEHSNSECPKLSQYVQIGKELIDFVSSFLLVVDWTAHTSFFFRRANSLSKVAIRSLSLLSRSGRDLEIGCLAFLSADSSSFEFLLILSRNSQSTSSGLFNKVPLLVDLRYFLSSLVNPLTKQFINSYCSMS